MQWDFGEYRLDTDNATLWRGDDRVELRAKTFDLLCYLVEHAGDLVRKETLLDEVWGQSYVVEGVLTTSMSELRKVFGDTAKQQRYIATVYRRGYRFVAPVLPADKADATAAEKPGRIEWSDGGNRGAAVLRTASAPGFVGRGEEVESIVDYLLEMPDCRILTLVGAGGIGKTRLALAVNEVIGHRSPDAFPDGRYFIALQSLHPQDNLATAIAESIGLQLGGADSSLDQLIAFVAAKKMLIVLDNVEHLEGADSFLQVIADSAPMLKFLVTSRHGINVQGAWFHPVDGLAYSEDVNSDAMQFFAQIARRSRPDFSLSANRAAVHRICQRVEGMPLALELAAGWLKVLSVEDVETEIARGIDILTAQHGSDSDRHSSVRAVIHETWQRLMDSERTALRYLAIFRGGSTREAIAEVIGAGLPLLAKLVDKALLRTTRQHRYKMHELIRQFAEEELDASPETALQARDKHARFFLKWLADRQRQLDSATQGDSCREIQAEWDNIRAAWRWAAQRAMADLLRSASAALHNFCIQRGHFPDGLAMFEWVIECLENESPEAHRALIESTRVRTGIFLFHRCRYEEALAALLKGSKDCQVATECALVYRYLGDYHFSHGRFCTAAEAKNYLEKSIALCEELNDKHLHAECLCELAILHTNLLVDTELSWMYANQAVELARQSARPDLLASTLDVLAWITNHRGDYQTAETTWREVLTIAERSGNRANEALAVNWLGWSAWSVGGDRLEEAATLHSDAIDRYYALGEAAGVAMACADRALALVELGRIDEARASCRRGLSVAKQIGREDHYVYNLYCLGAAELVAGDLRLARKQLRKSLQLALEHEEQTNKPVVVFFVAKLLFAESIDNDNERTTQKLSQVLQLLLFLQHHPPTWQAFKDRAYRLQKEVEAHLPEGVASATRQQSESERTAQVLQSIPTLLEENQHELAAVH